MDYYYWLSMGVIFFILELMSGTLLFLFLGISSSIMAVIIFILPNVYTEIQLILSSILAITSIIFTYYLHKYGKQQNKKDNNINDRLSKYIGLQTTLVSDVVNGIAQVNVDGSLWRVIIDSGKLGDKVIITQIKSTSFIAKKIN